mgnify:CR=1 FL=1
MPLAPQRTLVFLKFLENCTLRKSRLVMKPGLGPPVSTSSAEMLCFVIMLLAEPRSASELIDLAGCDMMLATVSRAETVDHHAYVPSRSSEVGLSSTSSSTSVAVPAGSAAPGPAAPPGPNTVDVMDSVPAGVSAPAAASIASGL